MNETKQEKIQPSHKTMRSSGFWEDDQAQAIVEFAVSIPLLLIFTFMVIQCVLMANASLMTQYAAYQAARTGMLVQMSYDRSNIGDEQFLEMQKKIMQRAATVCLVPVRYRTRNSIELGTAILKAHLGNTVAPFFQHIDELMSVPINFIDKILQQVFNVQNVLNSLTSAIQNLLSRLPEYILHGFKDHLSSRTTVVEVPQKCTNILYFPFISLSYREKLYQDCVAKEGRFIPTSTQGVGDASPFDPASFNPFGGFSDALDGLVGKLTDLQLSLDGVSGKIQGEFSRITGLPTMFADVKRLKAIDSDEEAKASDLDSHQLTVEVTHWFLLEVPFANRVIYLMNFFTKHDREITLEQVMQQGAHRPEDALIIPLVARYTISVPQVETSTNKLKYYTKDDAKGGYYSTLTIR